MDEKQEQVSLRADQVHLWFAFLAQIADERLLNEYRSLMTDAERSQEQRFHFDKDRVRYVVTRALVRTVLSRYAAVAPREWTFVTNAHGRPSIDSRIESALRISFNISHTDGLIVLGVTDRQDLGVDTENVSRRSAAVDLADHYFSPEEATALRALPEEEREERFLHYWTLKESYIKARGQGLSMPLDRFSFLLADDDSIEVSFRSELRDRAAAWRFWLLQPSSEHVAAICVRRAADAVQQLIMRRIIPLVAEEPHFSPTLRRSR